MTFISLLSFQTTQKHTFPYNVPAIKLCSEIPLDKNVTFFVGDNGTGKSTLIESIACKLGLPHMEGVGYDSRSYKGVRQLVKCIKLVSRFDYCRGFFFRAEDFGDLMNSVHRNDQNSRHQMGLDGEVNESVIKQMSDSENFKLHLMLKNYGQELTAFSHGEAYLHILHQRVDGNGVYILDEPESALSPEKQLALMEFIRNHLSKYSAQFIIATHSPILMAYPNAKIYEITEEYFRESKLEETEHYTFTKSFLNDPSRFLRHFNW